MPLHIIDHGENNRVEIDPVVAEEGHGTIVFHGSGGSVRIGHGGSVYGLNITLGHECHFDCGSDVRLGALEVYTIANVMISIGDRGFFTGHTRIYGHEAGAITIGDGCLIASNTFITTSDMHSIIDLDSGERINPPQDVVLEESVWLSLNATVLKGARIGRGSIVGLGAVVTGSIPEYTLAVGSPARVIRSRVTWKPDLV